MIFVSERSPSLNESEDLRTTAEGNVEAPGCWHEICVYYGIVDEGRASTEHSVASCVKTNKPVNNGWSLENQGTGLQLTGRALHVLVVDDNRDAADSLCMLLRLWGYDCRVAYDGAAGLQAACDYRPDCLLIDLAMPGLDGYTLARRVRAQPGLDDAKLVALTAFSDETHVRRSQEAGFHFHLVKPTEPLEIKRIMNMLNELVRLAGKTEEMTRQNVALASETKELLKEVKEDMQEVKEEVKELKIVKEDIKEIKEDVKDLKEELREVKEARVEDHPGDGNFPKPGSQAED